VYMFVLVTTPRWFLNRIRRAIGIKLQFSEGQKNKCTTSVRSVITFWW